jgi:site-specific DNA-methyltransferase (adenine-specific)
VITDDLAALATPIDQLELLDGNPRRGDIDAVARSLDRFGQRKPIVARRSDRQVVAGNHTLQAARKLGWDEIAVVWVDDDEVTAKAFALADNRTAELGDYDDQLLGDLLKAVGDVDPALLADAGWAGDAVAELLERLEPEQVPIADTDPDDIPESAPAKTVPGDVWLLGPHRVACGDSTVPTDFDKLMAGELADMVWTDPPYGVAVNAVESVEEAKRLRRRTDGKVILNDNLSPAELGGFLQSAFATTISVCRPGSVWFVAAPGGPLFLQFAIALDEMGIWRQTITWVKDQFAMGRSDYHGRHEPIFYGWTPGAAHQPPPDRTQDTVWEVPRPKRSPEHPTMKPVALIERAVVNHTKKGAVVLDPFGGSGTTLIACHQTGRVARLIELDPKYVDVICRRFQEHTGIKPIAEATGREHDFTKEK